MTSKGLGYAQAACHSGPARRLRYLWLDRRYLAGKHADAVIRFIAWHLPKRLVMWCYYRVAAHATTGEHATTDPSTLLMFDAIDRWPTR